MKCPNCGYDLNQKPGAPPAKPTKKLAPKTPKKK